MPGVFQCKAGKVAVWDGGTDDAPFNNPRGNIARVKFHSDLSYPKIISVRSVSITLPAMQQNANIAQSYVLFAHGRPGIPFITGRMILQSQKVPFVGSVPVAVRASTNQNPGFARWLTLGADATNVIVYEQSRAASVPSAPSFTIFPAVTIPIVVYVTDEILT